jgi:hypothetical protein
LFFYLNLQNKFVLRWNLLNKTDENYVLPFLLAKRAKPLQSLEKTLNKFHHRIKNSVKQFSGLKTVLNKGCLWLYMFQQIVVYSLLLSFFRNTQNIQKAAKIRVYILEDFDILNLHFIEESAEKVCLIFSDPCHGAQLCPEILHMHAKLRLFYIKCFENSTWLKSSLQKLMSWPQLCMY